MTSVQTNRMNRQQVIAKIKSMLALQEGTDFDGEASAAATLIDKLCKKHGITVDEATEVIASDELYQSFKRLDTSLAMVVNAVANFYDAKAYVKTDINGDKSIQVIGSEAQQIQVNLYSEYLLGVMNREADKAHKAEKIIAELTGAKLSSSFKNNFKKAFSNQVASRLQDMKKEENRVHEHKDAVSKALSTRRFTNGKRYRGAVGAGATAGAGVGDSVSLNRQASGGGTQRALAGV
jgi:hypothetical protein